MKTYWIPIVLSAAVLVVAGVRAADESSPALAATENADRYAAIIEAVAENPEMAVEITAELTRNFPESAPSIVASVIEGLPEWDDSTLEAVVAAAIGSAPDRQAEIEAAVAGLREPSAETIEPPSIEIMETTEPVEAGVAGNVEDPDSVRTADESSGGDYEANESEDLVAESEGDGDPSEYDPEILGDEDVRIDLSEIERPERLLREIAVMESLLGTFPERVPATVRRSVWRVSDEEWFWSVILVMTAIENAPEQEDAIVSAAISAAPHHEEVILSYVTEVPAVDPEEAEETFLVDDTELPAALLREIQLVQSLLSTFPDNAPEAVRRSVGRVSDEEAYWSVAIIWAALAEVPEQESRIIETAIAAAPHHEGEIRLLLKTDELPDQVIVAEHEEEEGAVEAVAPFTVGNAVESIELIDNRLAVRFEVYPTEPSRVRLAVQSLELSIRPERYFDPYQGRYLERDMATITGDGIVGLGFRVYPADTDQIDGLAAVMQAFSRMVSGAGDFAASVAARSDTGLLLRQVRTDIGDVYFYPSKRKFPAQFTGDFEDRTYALRLGGAVSLTRETVPAIRHLLENLHRYQDEYRSRLEARERQMEEFHEFTQNPNRQSAIEEDKEES